MHKIFVTAVAAAFSMLALAAAPAIAQDWSFEIEGEGDISYELEYAETFDWTVEAGSKYTGSGGAGSEGFANAYGDLSGVGAAFGEYAFGDGSAYSDTLGNNYAEAEYHSGSAAMNGGYALNGGLGWNDPAKVKYEGETLGGFAGSATTGLTYGTAFEYSNSGSLIYNAEADFEYTETP